MLLPFEGLVANWRFSMLWSKNKPKTVSCKIHSEEAIEKDGQEEGGWSQNFSHPLDGGDEIFLTVGGERK